MFVQFFAASVERENLSVCADENRARNSANSVVFGNRNGFVVRGLFIWNESFFVKHLFPGNFVFLEESFEILFFGGIVAGNADDLKALVVIGGVRFFDVWQFSAARTAPGCPEVNQNDFAGVIFCLVFGTVDERSSEFEFISKGIIESLFAFSAENGAFQNGSQLVDFRVGGFLKSFAVLFQTSFRGFVIRHFAGNQSNHHRLLSQSWGDVLSGFFDFVVDFSGDFCEFLDIAFHGVAEDFVLEELGFDVVSVFRFIH